LLRKVRDDKRIEKATNCDWTPPSTAGKAGESKKVFEGLKIPSSFCAGFAEERGDPKDGVPERMVLVTFAD
jgi:hypothetical protein